MSHFPSESESRILAALEDRTGISGLPAAVVKGAMLFAINQRTIEPVTFVLWLGDLLDRTAEELCRRMGEDLPDANSSPDRLTEDPQLAIIRSMISPMKEPGKAIVLAIEADRDRVAEVAVHYQLTPQRVRVLHGQVMSRCIRMTIQWAKSIA